MNIVQGLFFSSLWFVGRPNDKMIDSLHCQRTCQKYLFVISLPFPSKNVILKKKHCAKLLQFLSSLAMSQKEGQGNAAEIFKLVYFFCRKIREAAKNKKKILH